MATGFTKPTVIPQAWATGGQHAQIPNSATGTNRASFQEGFPAITSTPIDEGGIPPSRLDMNALGYIAMIHAFFHQNGGCFTFDSNVANAIGGYPQGALLWVLDSNGVPQYAVKSMKNGNNDNFVSNPSFINGTSWQKLTLNAAGDAMVGTLSDESASQIRNIAIVTEEPGTGVDGTIYAIIES